MTKKGVYIHGKLCCVRTERKDLQQRPRLTARLNGMDTAKPNNAHIIICVKQRRVKNA